jgi:Mitochondrial carrier protein
MVWGEEGIYGTASTDMLLILQEEGPFGFFRGMSPRLARKVLSAAIVWTGYEEIVKAISRRKVESGH